MLSDLFLPVYTGGIFLFFVGACFGSFVNMAVYRIALQYKLLRNKNAPRDDIGGGRSYCDSCGKQLSWSENIPIVSWILQSGKTRCCKKKLDWSYPLVEMAAGILFFLNYSIFNRVDIFGMAILILMLFSFVFDAKYMILPDWSTVFMAIFSVLYNFFNKSFDLYNLTAAGAGFGFIWLLWWLTKGKGMGFGDVKLAGMMGLLLGFKGLVMAMYFAFVSGAGFGLFLIVFRHSKLKSKLAFGPFLILGTIVSWWFLDKISLWF